MSIFPVINHINDLLPHIEGHDEIKVMRGTNDSQIVCYMFADKNTFSNPWLRECRGIVFGRGGNIVGRPLHKFFNIGEREDTLMSALDLTKASRMMDKRDGSMIHTVWMNNMLWIKSKKSFTSAVVSLAWSVLNRDETLYTFCKEFAKKGYTLIFELTSPYARIVLPHENTELHLLHIRDTVTGIYYDFARDFPEMYERYQGIIKQVEEFNEVQNLLNNVNSLRNVEGYVVQFDNGDMVKHKCEWYRNLHRSVTMLRQRDIAQAVLDESLDDIKSALRELNIDMTEVERIESKVVDDLTGIYDTIHVVANYWKDLTRKDFAIKLKDHPYFGLFMKAYLNQSVDVKEFYKKNMLKQWSLDILSGGVEDSDG